MNGLGFLDELLSIADEIQDGTTPRPGEVVARDPDEEIVSIAPEGEPADDAPAPGQETLFGADEDFHVAWREWRGMPEFVQEDLEPWKTLPVHFATPEDYRAFAELVGQKLGPRTRSIWYPPAEIGRFADKRYADGEAAS